MHTQTTRPGRSRNLGGRRGQGQAGQAEAGQPRPQRANAPTARSKSQRGIGPREKVFGPGRLVPLDRNAKVRVTMVARALMRHQEKGKGLRQESARRRWRCSPRCSGASTTPRPASASPSYEAIAEAAGCARSTGYEAIRALEQVGVPSWVNRIKCVREYVPGCSATRCNDVARSRVAGSAFSRLGFGEARRQGCVRGIGRIKPREPRRPQPDATTLRGWASFAV
jgi:hypothetical protein